MIRTVLIFILFCLSSCSISRHQNLTSGLKHRGKFGFNTKQNLSLNQQVDRVDTELIRPKMETGVLVSSDSLSIDVDYSDSLQVSETNSEDVQNERYFTQIENSKVPQKNVKSFHLQLLNSGIDNRFLKSKNNQNSENRESGDSGKVVKIILILALAFVIALIFGLFLIVAMSYAADVVLTVWLLILGLISNSIFVLSIAAIVKIISESESNGLLFLAFLFLLLSAFVSVLFFILVANLFF